MKKFAVAGHFAITCADAAAGTNIFFNASQTATVISSNINDGTIRSGDYRFIHTVAGYWVTDCFISHESRTFVKILVKVRAFSPTLRSRSCSPGSKERTLTFPPPGSIGSMLPSGKRNGIRPAA